jgi:hypothetical protein
MFSSVGRAESIGTIADGASPSTALANGRAGIYYGQAPIGSRTIPVTAVGQTFSVSQAFNVTGMSFWLNAGLSAPPPIRAYIQNVSTGELLFSSLANFTDQSIQAGSNGYTNFTLNLSMPVALQQGQQYVAFFSGLGLNLSTLAQVGAGVTALDTGNAVVSALSVASATEYFRNGGTYTTLSMDLAMSLRGTTGAIEVIPPPPPPSDPPPSDPPPTETPPPSDPGPGIVHSPEPASCLMWCVLGLVGTVFGWRARRRNRVVA